MRTVRLSAGALAGSPAGFATLLAALEDALVPPTSVLLTGDPAECAAWQRALERTYRPTVRVFDLAGAGDLPAALRKGAGDAAGSAAWVCRGTQCLPPCRTLDETLRAIESPA